MCYPDPTLYLLGSHHAEREHAKAIRLQKAAIEQHFRQAWAEDAFARYNCDLLTMAAASTAASAHPAKDCANCGSPEFVKHRGRWVCSYCRTDGA